MSLAILAAFILLFAAFLMQRKIAKLAQAHNRELRDRIIKQADYLSKLESINECQRQTIVSRGGIVESWPEIISDR